MRTLLAISLLLACSSAEAGLIKGDFQAPGDGYLVTDTATNLQWLSPFATRGQKWNSSAVQTIETNYGLRYATYQETYSMVISNFGIQTTVALGDAAGFTAAQNYFDIFGKTTVGCSDGNVVVACPRLQGLTADTGLTAAAHYALGYIQFGNTGWMIDHNSWPDSIGDTQMGSWLVRTAPANSAATPEPASVGLALAGLGAVLLFRRR